MEKLNYGNWVPAKLLWLLGTCLVASIIVLKLALCLSWHWIWIAIGVLATICFLCGFVYMFAFHQTFGKGLMDKIHDYVKSHLHWDGKGKLLDVGCGAGALTIRCAKTWKESEVVGIDYFGAGWDYSLKMCQRNAQIEDVEERSHFQKGDANHLDFPDETFDAVVSNFVYHEVRNNPDKEALIKETLRVLKRGGSFSLQDLFGQKNIYGDFEATVEHLKREVSEIHYVKNSEKEIGVPGWMAIPGMLADIGIIYGVK